MEAPPRIVWDIVTLAKASHVIPSFKLMEGVPELTLNVLVTGMAGSLWSFCHFPQVLE